MLLSAVAEHSQEEPLGLGWGGGVWGGIGDGGCDDVSLPGLL